MSAIVNEASLAEQIRKFGQPSLFVGENENDSPWVPFVPDIFIRHLAFDVRSNTFINVLWVQKPGMLGTHRHRCPVWGYVLEGSWYYKNARWRMKISGTNGTQGESFSFSP